MSDYSLLINGDLIRTKDSFPVINPANGEVFARAPECSIEQVNQAVEAAEQAFPAWKSDIAKRKEALMAMANAIQANSERIAEVLTLEQGKPLSQSKMEIMGSVMQIQLSANLTMPVEVVQDSPKGLLEVHRKPYGVVATITPWNFPVSIAMGKVATALISGNTVILKPSPFTPLSTLLVAEAVQSALPPGVLNIISGSDPLGSHLTAHPSVRKIDFTGSVNTGKKVAAAAAPDLKRITLELGGNDAAIVLSDVNVKQVAKSLFWGAFTNSGQVCIAAKRVYAHESVYSNLVEAMAEMASKTSVGDGMVEGNRLGPINNKPQFDRVRELVNDARNNGATIVTGGDQLSDNGYCFANTIITDVDDSTRIVAEEQFGPVLPILSFSDTDEAITRANNTNYGLGGSVWSGDIDKATEVAQQLECGTAWVNQHLALNPMVPFGGSKWSGIGYINGRWGVEGSTEIQVINVKRA
ncbi:MAG: aldehyde dehydrogenase family protein [Pseudomonadales bacterium]|nr:aldehyde dehydrogenase family protein [Pseudomonadales bacterium]